MIAKRMAKLMATAERQVVAEKRKAGRDMIGNRVVVSRDEVRARAEKLLNARIKRKAKSGTLFVAKRSSPGRINAARGRFGIAVPSAATAMSMGVFAKPRK